jgi:hypothetical protein
MADDNMAGDSSLVLRHATAGDMPRIEPLWKALYQHQFEHGMLLRLPEGAYDAWLKSVVPFLVSLSFYRYCGSFTLQGGARC